MPVPRKKPFWNSLLFWRKKKESRQQKQDRLALEKSGLLEPAFLGKNYQNRTAKQVALKYLRAWSEGKGARKPFAGFHPGIYADQNAVTGRDYFAHWLAAGKPDGPWITQVIYPSEKKISIPRTECRIALQIHVYYTDLLRDIVSRLNKNKFRPDLLVSVSESCSLDEIHSALHLYPGRYELKKVPNLGRDIGPLLTAFGSEILKNYDIVGHIHTKKTAWHPDQEFGKIWREFLLETTIGGAHAMMDTILHALLDQKELGLVFPEEPVILGWEKLKPECASLMQKMGLSFAWGENILFPAGSFFWARKEALRPLFELGLQWDDYPPEPIGTGGTILHALERLPYCVACCTGFRSATSHVPGLTK